MEPESDLNGNLTKLITEFEEACIWGDFQRQCDIIEEVAFALDKEPNLQEEYLDKLLQLQDKEYPLPSDGLISKRINEHLFKDVSETDEVAIERFLEDRDDKSRIMGTKDKLIQAILLPAFKELNLERRSPIISGEIAGWMVVGSQYHAYVEKQAKLRRRLRNAIEFDNDNLIETALDAGADINTEIIKGKTLLMYAASRKKEQLCKNLLKRNADTQKRNLRGNTALMLAAKANSYESCMAFVNHCMNKQVKPFFEFLLCFTRNHPHIRLPKDLRMLLFNQLASAELYPLLQRKNYKNQSAYDIWPIEELNPEACMNTVAKLMLPPKMEQLNLQDEFRLGMPYLNSKATPYQVLGLADTASADDIKKAYRNLARIYHPDKFEDNKALLAEAKIATRDEATTAFQMISDAYDKLKPQ